MLKEGGLKFRSFFLILFLIIILSSSIYAEKYDHKKIPITGKTIFNNPDKLETQISITGKIVFPTRPNELQKIYSRSLPAIGKINVYYEYDIFVPKLDGISFKRTFSHDYPDYRDLDVNMNRNINGFDDFFGDSFWNNFYSGEYYLLDENAELYTIELNLKDISEIKKDFYKYHEGNLPENYGSGFLIDPEGHILTNAHVATLVASQMKAMEEYILSSNYLNYYYILYVNAYYNEVVSMKDYEDYLKKMLYLEENLKISNLKVKKIEFIIGEGQDVKKYDAELIDFNEGYYDELGGRDWALLKIEGENFPALYLGDSDMVSIGEDIVVIGFPWASEGITENRDIYVSPTPTYGKVSNIVPSGNFKDIQIDISIEGGNSGGPGLNSLGEVIGIATSGYLGLGGTYNYLTPINDIKKELTIIPRQSRIDTLWEKGLENFWAENYLSARLNFKEIKAMNPAHPYVDDILSQLENFSNTDKEKIEIPMVSSDSKKSSVSGISIIFIFIGIAIVLLLFMIVLKIYTKKKKLRFK